MCDYAFIKKRTETSQRAFLFAYDLFIHRFPVL